MRFTAIDRLPDGRERVVATGLTLAQTLAFVAPADTWAVYFVRS